MKAMGVRRLLEAAWRGVASEIGRAELLILLGVALVTVGLWPQWGRGSLVVPGLISLWIALAPVAVPVRKR